MTSTRTRNGLVETIAVSGAPGLVWVGGGEWDWMPRNLGEAWESTRGRIRQLWFTPSAVEALGMPETLPASGKVQHPFLERGSLSASSRQEGLTAWLTVWAEGHQVECAFPQWDSGSPFHGLTYAPELLAEVTEFTDATGMYWRRSGAVTSDSWLRDHYRRRGTVQAVNYPPMAAGANLEPDIHWVQTHLTPHEQRARWCHAFDLNAMYLGAASSLPLPAGEFVHEMMRISVNQIGYPLPPGYWREFESWVTTPTLERRLEWHRKMGADAIVVEGYYWPTSHRYLEPWYKTLRDAWTRLLEYGPSPALEAVKQVYRQGIGRFGSTRRTIEGDPLYQPYWRQAVQAEARGRLERHIERIEPGPCAVDVDCLYFLTNRNAENFARFAGIELDDRVGKFKYAGTMRGRDARELLSHGVTSSVLEGLRRGVQS